MLLVYLSPMHSKEHMREGVVANSDDKEWIH